jgi:hypothetical protein
MNSYMQHSHGYTVLYRSAHNGNFWVEEHCDKESTLLNLALERAIYWSSRSRFAKSYTVRPALVERPGDRPQETGHRARLTALVAATGQLGACYPKPVISELAPVCEALLYA